MAFLYQRAVEEFAVALVETHFLRVAQRVVTGVDPGGIAPQLQSQRRFLETVTKAGEHVHQTRASCHEVQSPYYRHVEERWQTFYQGRKSSHARGAHQSRVDTSSTNSISML